MTSVATASSAQLAPTPSDSLKGTVPSDRLLLKVGLNAARILRNGGYYGLASRVPLSFGAEYALSSRFTLYSQLDTDFGVPTYKGYYEGNVVVPTAALGIGARYYYNQAGRARHNRAHGSFVGNYLAAEAHLEMQQRVYYNGYSPVLQHNSYDTHSYYAPSLNLVWGMQRRLGRSFLFDFNAGLGLGASRSDLNFGGYSSGALNLSTQFNLGIYFGR